MKLQKAPAGGKVKCPRCGAIVPVGSPAAPAAPSRSLTPDDNDFDFGQINFPSAKPASSVSSFPVSAAATVYEGPIPGDPLAGQEEDGNAPAAAAAAGAPSKPAGKGKPLPVKLIAGVVSGLVGFVVMFFLVSMMFGGGGGGGEASANAVDAATELKKNVPPGYEVVEFEGCAVYMPNGDLYREMPPGAMESKVVQSSKTGSIFFFGAMDNGKMALDNEQMRKKAMRFVAGTPTERNGYQGIKGRVSVSSMLPDMMIEAYVVDERYILIGSQPASMGADVETQMSIDRAAESEEQSTFFDSLKVGPKSGGIFF